VQEESISLLEKKIILENLSKSNRIIDLSMALLKFQILPRHPINITRQDREKEKQVILVAPRGSVFIMPDGRRVFTPNRLAELEEFTGEGLRSIRTIQKDVIWATLVGLSGIFGIMLAWILPRIRFRKDKAKIKRFLDENGDIVYMARHPEGNLTHLLTVGSDRIRYLIHEPLASSLARMGFYVILLTYPSSATSWREVLGLDIDPRVEIIMDPNKAY
jgi:hypothetical protein